jgi:hypothetical protein
MGVGQAVVGNDRLVVYTEQAQQNGRYHPRPILACRAVVEKGQVVGIGQMAQDVADNGGVVVEHNTSINLKEDLVELVTVAPDAKKLAHAGIGALYGMGQRGYGRFLRQHVGFWATSVSLRKSHTQRSPRSPAFASRLASGGAASRSGRHAPSAINGRLAPHNHPNHAN